MMGYPLLSRFAHRLEDFFKLLATGGAWHPEIETLLLQGVDLLHQTLAACRQGRSGEELETAAAEIFLALEAYLGTLSPEAERDVLTQETGEDLRVYLFQTEVESCLQRLREIWETPGQPCLREEFTLVAQELGGLGEMLDLSDFSQLCRGLETELREAEETRLSAIAAQALEAWTQAQALVIVQQGALLPTLLPELSLDFLNPLPDEMAQEIVPQSGVVRLAPRQLAGLADLVGELTLDRSGLSLQLQGVKSQFFLLQQRVQRLREAHQGLRYLYDHESTSPLPLTLPTAFDRLEMDLYSDRHLLLQELMETIVQIQEVTEDLQINLGTTERSTRQLTRTSQLLQNQVTQLRMRPFAELTAKLSRALRELTTQSEKLVALEISGTQTLLERTILEALSDPLLHLLRNAFDHGIETPANRQALGKPPTGTITLAASYRGHQTIITLSDDGAGMNTEKIHARAVELGLLTPDTPPIETSDLLNLIFTPGFSTADQITEISGRGMGMDIVRTKIQEVNGRISMATRPRHGTTFTISVPFTLSVLPVLLVESAGMLLAFPTNIVEEILLPTPSMCLESAGQTFLNLDGYLLPFLCLKEWLNFPHSLVRNTRESSPLINQSLALIIANNQELVALKVDAYWGEEEVTLRNIEGTFPLPKGFSNCTILGDGRVVPLLDSATLIESLQTQKLTPITPQDNTFILNRKSTVMVIDDSINVRRFLALTLEKWGYRVQQAKDGQEAMEKLQEGLSPVAVICDLEMPRLDGYGFLAQLRAQPRWQSLPVIMLTSRSGDKHRQLAFTLGASAYFAKPFQEQELLTTLKSLVEVNVR